MNSQLETKLGELSVDLKGRCIWRHLLLPPTAIVATACLLRIRGFFFFFPQHPTLWLPFPQIQLLSSLCRLHRVTQHEHLGTRWPKCWVFFFPFCDVFSPPNGWSLHLLFLFAGVLCTISGDNDCPLSTSLQWLPEMLLVSLLPHYNPLCVLREWLMMIMQMLHRRAAWVIITAENEAFWNSLTADEKTMGLQCAWESIFISLGVETVAMVMLTKPCGEFCELRALWVLIPCRVHLCAQEVWTLTFFQFWILSCNAVNYLCQGCYVCTRVRCLAGWFSEKDRSLSPE